MDENERKFLATIQPDSSFMATYVIRFQRRHFEAQKYQIALDVSYYDPAASVGIATEVREIVSVTAMAQISPHASNLSVIAVVAALLGMTVQISLGGSQNLYQDLSQLVTSGRILVGPIIGLIFFNAYEYTALGKDLRMPIGWRSALLIGALCGLAQDRIVAAIKALVG